MIYSTFKDKQLSLLGFGAMRLPTCEDGSIDEAQVREMTAFAISNGVNYFDTAWPYHEGNSERVISRVLKDYPRDSYYLADKYPGHQILSSGYNPAEIFEEQLKKCGVDYFDFYLLHNLGENRTKPFDEFGMWDWIQEKKAEGKIRHIGFSFHSLSLIHI